jgi:hypothetical protein
MWRERPSRKRLIAHCDRDRGTALAERQHGNAAVRARVSASRSYHGGRQRRRPFDPTGPSDGPKQILIYDVTTSALLAGVAYAVLDVVSREWL